MALVLFVFVTVLILDAGLRQTLVSIGSPGNVVIIRQDSETEIQSGIQRDQAALIEAAPEVARGADGRVLVSKEVVVLNSLPKRDDPDKRANVVVRGVMPIGVQLRPQVRIIEGRMFRLDSIEIVAGSSVRRQFAGVAVGQTLNFAQRNWTVVGVFDAGKSGFDLLGMTLSIMFSLGAMIGAAITMYAAVALRTAEIGMLRALGFRCANVLAAFLGGFLPALKASRMKIVNALRAD